MHGTKIVVMAVAVTAVIAGGLAWGVSWAVAQQAGGDVPQVFSYQGYLTDAGGKAVADDRYAVTFRLYQSPDADAKPVWEEEVAVTTERGYFTVLLGQRAALRDVFERHPVYLGIQVGDEPELEPRQEIASVPFAIQAGNAATLGGLPASEFARVDDIVEPAPVEDHTVWHSPLNMIAKPNGLSPSELELNRGALGNTIRVTTAEAGDSQWIALPLAVQDNLKIKRVKLCYDLSNSSSFISQIRLSEELEPPTSPVKFDDGTDRVSSESVCIESAAVNNFTPAGAVTLSLRLNFASTADYIDIGAVGIVVGE